MVNPCGLISYLGKQNLSASEMARVQIIDAQHRRTAIGLGLLRDRTNIDEEDLAAAMRKIQLRSRR